MTEADWLSCEDPYEMLAFLGGKVSDRKLRLFLCACCRRVWDQLPDERSRQAVRTAERYADGLATEYELIEARTRAVSAAPRRGAPAAWAVYHTTNKWPAQTARKALAAASEAGARAATMDARIGRANEGAAWHAGLAAESREQARLLREVVGNPFRPVRVDPSWLAWNDGAVRKMARVVYHERRFADLPLLADALEESGCADAELLYHSRRPGEHVPGCFALDLLARME